MHHVPSLLMIIHRCIRKISVNKISLGEEINLYIKIQSFLLSQRVQQTAPNK
jgi:hypothetical protein